jgi:metal-dependent amidase/aminoacylase/carboxypeptidase family protein
VHGIVRHGGDAANIVPERTLLDYIVRSETLDGVFALEERIAHCFEAGAIATGCTVEVRRAAPAYSHIESDRDLSRSYGENVKALGRKPLDLPRGRRLGAGSTDMANVTLALPAIHPTFGVTGAVAQIHNPDFTAACATPEADESMLFAAAALAWTGIDIASNEEVRERLLRQERNT